MSSQFKKGYDPRRCVIPPANPNPPVEPTYPVNRKTLRKLVTEDSMSGRALSMAYCRHRDVIGHALRGTGKLTLSEADELAIRWGLEIEDLIQYDS